MSNKKNGIDYTPRLKIPASGTTSQFLYSKSNMQNMETKQQGQSIIIDTTKSSFPSNNIAQTAAMNKTTSAHLSRNTINSIYNPYIYTYSRNSLGVSQKVQDGTSTTSQVPMPASISYSKRAINSIQAQSLVEEIHSITIKETSNQDSEAIKSTVNKQPSQNTSSQAGKNDVFTQNYRVSNTYRPISTQLGMAGDNKVTLSNTNIAQGHNQKEGQFQIDHSTLKDIPAAHQSVKSKLNKSSKSETPFQLGLNDQDQAFIKGEIPLVITEIITNSPKGEAAGGQQRYSQLQQQYDISGLRYATAYSSHGATQNSQRMISPNKKDQIDLKGATNFNRFIKFPQKQQDQTEENHLQRNGHISQSALIIKQSQQINSSQNEQLGIGCRTSQTPKRQLLQPGSNISFGGKPIQIDNRLTSPMRPNDKRREKQPIQLTLLPIQAEQPKQVIFPLTEDLIIPTISPAKHKKSFSNIDVNPSSLSKDPSEMFLIRDQDTGQVYDIRQIDKIDAFSKTNNQEYFDKLKRRHKNAWQGWWNSKRENNLKLIEAVKNNKFEIVQQLLQQHQERADIRADCDFKDEGSWTSIHYAVENQNIPIVNLLIASDADVNQINDKEETPLMLVANSGNSELVDLLLKAGADSNLQNVNQNTALHFACMRNHLECVRILMSHKHIECSIRNQENKLAVELTSSPEIQNLLGIIIDKKLTSENRKTVCLLSKQSTADYQSSPNASAGVPSSMPKRSSYRHENVLSQSSFQGNYSQKNTGQNGSRKQQGSDSGSYWQSSFPGGTKASGGGTVELEKKNSGGSTNGNNLISNSGGGQIQSLNQTNKQSISSSGSSNTLSNGSNFYSSHLSTSGVQAIPGTQLLASGSTLGQQQQQPWRVVIHDFPNESILKMFSSADSADFLTSEVFSHSLIENPSMTTASIQKDGLIEDSIGVPTGIKQHQKAQSLEVPIKSNSDVNNNYNQYEDQQVRVGPDNFRIVNQIGRGSFGEVYLVEKKGTNQLYAMKMLHKSKVIGQNLTKYALTERNVLSIMSHPFIVKLKFAFQTSKELFLIMEFMPGGDLSHALQRDKRFSESRARIYLVEILLAIRYLHQNDIIYRDLKPENIVIDSEGHAMLTDFGLSKDGIYDQYSTHSFCGSLAYLAPEMIKRSGHGKAVDFYHLGVLLYEMLTGAPPFFSDSKDDICHNIVFSEIRFPSHVSDHARNLISRFLIKNPSKRLGFGKNDFEEIKKHPFFSGINWTSAIQRKLKPPPPILKPIIESKNKSTPNFMMTMTPEGMISDNHISGWSFMNSLEKGEENQFQYQIYPQEQQLYHYSSQPQKSSPQPSYNPKIHK